MIRPTACCALGMRAGCGGGHANESAPSQRKIQFQATAAGDDGAMQIGQACELDHGIDDLLPVWSGMRLNHLALLNDGRGGCSICHAARRALVAAGMWTEEASLPPMSSSISPDSSTIVSG